MEQARPLAIVGTKAITENDVTQAILSLGARAQEYNTPEGRAAILEQLIEQALFLADAKKTMLEFDPGFKAQLQRVKEELLVQYSIQKALSKVTVTEAEIKKFFDENPDEFKGEPTVSASHILVDDEAECKRIIDEISSGAIAFEAAAKKYSACPSAQNGGALGTFGRGQMVPEFDAACFDMEEGEMRGPIQTQFGYHIILLTGKQDAKPITYAQAHDAIAETLRAQKQQKAYQSKVNQMKILYPVQR